MNESCPVKLIRIGAKQVIEVPSAFELPGEYAMMRKEGDRLIIEPMPKQNVPPDTVAPSKPIDKE